MKYLYKAAVAALTGVSLIAAASAVSAQTVSPTGPVTASGQLTQSLLGTNETICNVTFSGEALSNGFRFDSYTGSWVSGGDLACDDSIDFGNDGLVVTAVPNQPGKLNLEHILISTRDGDCEAENVELTWNGSGVTFPPGTLIDPVCNFAGTLTISPATTITW